DVGWSDFEDSDSDDNESGKYDGDRLASKLNEVVHQTGVYQFSAESRFQDAPNVKEVEVSLEELLYGCTKVETFTRTVYDPMEKVIIEEETFEIVVKPGAFNGMALPFSKIGDQPPSP